MMAAGEMTMPGLDKKPPKAPERAQAASRAGLTLERFFSQPGIDPFSEVEWELRAAVIAGEDGRVVFEQRDVEVPRMWSQTATNVVVSKYFRGPLGSPRRESSVRQLIGRVVDTIAGWGERQGYFADDAGARHLQGRTDRPAGDPARGLQQPGLFQRRYRAQAAMLGLLHPEGRRQHGLDPELVPQRGTHLQRRLGRGREPFGRALVPREALGRRHRLGPAQLHEGGRRLGGRDQVGRQDPARGQDGGAQRRPSRTSNFSSSARRRRSTRRGR